jgi:SAM-dependent methyltransferase
MEYDFSSRWQGRPDAPEIVLNMVNLHEPSGERGWQCLYCRGPLLADTTGLRCAFCYKQYPVIAGIPILVSEPAGYLRSELALLRRVPDDARRRRDLLQQIGRELGLSKLSLGRLQEEIETAVARAEILLSLLEPAAGALDAVPPNTGEASGVWRSSWEFNSFMPYFVRDWTETAEIDAASAVIGSALKDVFPDASQKSLVLAGCGAGGLLAKIAADFERVVGFDLALPMLRVARHMLDGGTLELRLPRAIIETGHLTLRRPDPVIGNANVELVAMDALETAFADGSIDCVITSFLTDLMPDPRRLAREIRRMLSSNGVWINYGPPGPRDAPWRFDQSESQAFFGSVGFSVVRSQAHRTTYLDLSRDCLAWPFRSHVCYLTTALKTGQLAETPKAATPDEAELPEVVPEFYPAATLIDRRRMSSDQTRIISFRHERIPGRQEVKEIGSDTARILTLVDGKRTVREIADAVCRNDSAQSSQETIRAFARYFSQGLLAWRRGN